MKFFAPVLAAVADATITLNLEKLTNFDTALTMRADSIPLSPEEKVSFAVEGTVNLNLFEGKLSLADSGHSSSHVDCTSSPYARYMEQCRNPVMKAISEISKSGAGELFIDSTSGTMGLKGHETGHHPSGAGYEVTFCAVVNIPPRALPPPAMLKQRLNERMVATVQERLNHVPHTEEGGVATFPGSFGEGGFGKTRGFGKIHTDGGDPVEFDMKNYEPDHRPYSPGWKGASEPSHLGSEFNVEFKSWTSPSSGFSTFTCHPAASTDLHAHPEAKRSLAALNLLTTHLRQHEELSWLPENPAMLFMAELENQRQDAKPQESSLSPMVTSLLAGVSGGLVVLAFFHLARKNSRQEPLLSEA